MRVALAGDTMLGRGVAERLRSSPPSSLVAPELVAAVREADLVLLNLECCISERGRRWPEPSKPFFFRAPPAATELLAHLGVDCVSLANNHALDFGAEALLDTLDHLAAAGIAWVGAGTDEEAARAPVVLEASGERLAVVAASDHPAEFAATEDAPGIALAPFDGRGVPGWLSGTLASIDADAVLVTPHWGPNMRAEPLPRIRAAAHELLRAGATLVAGHSAHVFQGAERGVLYDLGDFLDDYAVDPVLRNDVGLLFLVDLGERIARRVEALPLTLDYCFTRLAEGEDAAWARRRFASSCAALGTELREEEGRLVIDWSDAGEAARGA